MKSLIILSATLFIFTSCVVELELDPPHVIVENIEEYETKEIISEVWSRGVLVYEEVIYTTWLEVELYNSGGFRAEYVWAEITFYDGHRNIKTISIDFPDIRAGNTYNYTLETGFESIYDYTDYEVNVYWE